MIVKGVDTLLGASPVEIEADMVVLATAGVANKGAEDLAQKMHISYDPYQFFAEAHPKLKPVETNTAGIFLAGACQAPKRYSRDSGDGIRCSCESSKLIFTSQLGA